MTFFAVLTVIAAWGSVLLGRDCEGGLLRALLVALFLGLGVLFTLAGGFAYWWDSGMRPTQASPFLLICGLLTLASQAGAVLRGVLENEGGFHWPGRH
jgi:hypothetical protein